MLHEHEVRGVVTTERSRRRQRYLEGAIVAVKYQIFVSSTYEDLKVERDEVIRAILEMGHIPVGMEMFSAADEEQWQIIARHIDESDYYAVIAAHRYGSEINDVSYTRKEYEYALLRGIPVLGFVIDNAASWPADRVDHGDAKTKLDEFKDLIRLKPVGTWATAVELHAKFSIALQKAMTANPQVGWVRASETVSSEVTAELARLSLENARLREREHDLNNGDATTRRAQLVTIDRQLASRRRTWSLRKLHDSSAKWFEEEHDRSLKWFFRSTASLLIAGADSETITNYLGGTKFTASNAKERLVPPVNFVDDCLTDLFSLDLVHSTGAGKWVLTEVGQEMIRKQRLDTFDSPEEQSTHE